MWEAIRLVMSAAWKWLKPVLIMIWRDIDDEIYAVAEDVVRRLTYENITNEEKRKKAFNEIKSKVKEQGGIIGDSLVNLLIELVLQKIKSEQRGQMKIQWHLTDRCNQRCKHCYQTEYDGEELKFRDWVNILGEIRMFYSQLLQMYPNEKMHLSLTGGEPFILGDNFIRFLYLLHMNRDWTTYSIMTNGTMVGEKEAEHLVTTGCTSVQVSLDGLRENHDLLRGNGNFKKVLEKISLMRKYGLFIVVSFTATVENYKDFPALAQVTYEAGANAIWSDRILPIDTDKDVSHLLLDKETTRKYLKSMRDARDKMLEIDSKFQVRMNRALQFLYGGGEAYSCQAGKHLLIIMPNGDILPCRRMPEILGNIKTNRLFNIWLNHPFMQYLRCGKPEGCRGCNFVNRCNGGLKCLSYCLKADPHKKDPGCFLEPAEKKEQI